jgi:hypothetical protein
MSLLCPRQCISTHGTPDSAATRAMSGSASPPDTSLITRAPASRAADATAALVVSTDSVIPPDASARITGRTRERSVSASTLNAPGLVDSPPTSMMSAPRAHISWACFSASSTLT